MNLKIAYKNEIKKIKFPVDFESLLNYVKKAIAELPEQIKFFYIDPDEELISVSNDDDLISFKDCSEKPESLKLFIFSS